MRNNELNTLVKCLSERQKAQLSPYDLKPFGGEIYSCPWLTYFLRNSNAEVPRIMLMMQDWGCWSEGIPLEGEVEWLADRKSWKKDRTLSGLSRIGLQKLILDREILVTNAVWGLRASEPKCRDLGPKIHKAAFACWRDLVQKLRPDILILGGSWATWNARDWGAHATAKYLDRWEQWAKPSEPQEPRIVDLSGVTLIIRHPCLPGPIEKSKELLAKFLPSINSSEVDPNTGSPGTKARGECSMRTPVSQA
jgi:hypothetical protein